MQDVFRLKGFGEENPIENCVIILELLKACVCKSMR
jgi:hypothetical protein